MSETIDPQVIKRTQDLLGKYVKKPPLTPKLLGKPPFRYIHDILNVVINQTGFLKGLYTSDELSSDNIKDKEAKIKFLQKAIDATSLAIGESFAVRPNKIVAGHDVEKTNEWFQAIAKAIEKKVNSDEAVKQIVSGVKPTSQKRPSDSKVTKSSETKGKPERSSKEPSKVKRDPGSKEVRPGKPASKSSVTKAPTGTKSSSNAKETTKDSRRSRDDASKKDRKEEDKRRSSRRESEKEEKAKKEKRTNNSPPPPSRRKQPMEVPQEPVETSPPASIPSDDVSNSTEMKEEELPERFRNGHSTPEGKMLRPRSRASMKIEKNDSDDIFDANLDETSQPVGISSEELARTGINGPGTEPVMGSLMNGQAREGSLNRRDSSSSFQNDPAIMKALGNDGLPGRNGLLIAGLSPAEATDSGVGSLESPKNSSANSHREESLPNTAGPRRSKTPAVAAPAEPQQHQPEISPGPRQAGPAADPSPLRAYHPDLSEDATADLPQTKNDQEADPFERPRTGMSMRPRTGRRTARPVSARPAPPKVRERREIPQEEIPRPPTGRPTANVIVDNGSLGQNGVNDVDDDDHFTVGETKPLLDQETFEGIGGLPTAQANAVSKEAQELLEGDQEAKGILVAQILETKKELEDDRRESFSPETPGHRRVPLEQALPGDVNRRREKELIRKDVEKLTNSIQSLTRSVNPLAKMLDYLQEDLDSMQNELSSWRKENKTLSQNLKAEESSTEQALTHLKSQLKELEEAIFEQREKISTVKSNILRNERHFMSLLGESK